MKKYKLKKAYPGIQNKLKIGDILHLANYGSYTNDSLSVAISPVNVEVFPEYWEEIVEKEWEILSFEIRDKNKDLIIYKKQQVGLFKGKHGTFSEEGLLGSIKANGTGGGQVYSVRRLSDNEIFSVGDTISDLGGGVAEIIHIIPLYYTLSIEIKGTCSRGNISLQTLKKIPKIKPFITEDGVEMQTTADKVFGVSINSTTISMATIHWSEDTKEYRPLWIGFIDKWFSTAQLAKEYIYMNKPVFSINDFLNMEGIFYDFLSAKTRLALEAAKRIKL